MSNASILNQILNIPILVMPQSTLIGYVNCDTADLIVTIDLFPIVYSIGLILNTLCSIIFYRIAFTDKRQKEESNKMFEIYFYKSLNDTFLFFINMFSSFYFCYSCDAKYSLLMSIWYILFNFYLTLILELNSTYLEVLATLDRYLTINPQLKQRIKIFNSKHFYLVYMIILLFFSMAFYIHKFFEYNIIHTISNSTVKYQVVSSDFTKTNLDKDLKYIHVILRDMLGISMLFTLNILILKTMHTIFKNKKKIKNLKEKSIEDAEKRTTQMVVMSNVIFIIGHTPICLYYFQISYLNNITCFYNFTRANLFLSYSVDFFIYFGYNKRFRDKLFNIMKSTQYQPSVSH